MKKFEYEDEYQDPMNKTWHKILKNKGLDGWELISMTLFEWETDESGYSYVKEYCYMFKREIK